MDHDRLHQSLRWAAENGVLREYEVVEAAGFAARVMLGTKPVWASLGKEPLEGCPPMRLLGFFGLTVPYNTTVTMPLKLSKSSGGPLYIDQDAESETLVNLVKFNGRVLSMFESSVEVVVRSGRLQGHLSSTMVIDVGDARVELRMRPIADDPSMASIRIGEHLEGIVYPYFTPAYFFGEENMRGVFD